MNLRNIVLAAALAISPLTSVLAQTTGPGIKADSMKESSAVDNGSAPGAHQAGATGSTVVAGDKSTVAGDKKATTDTKTGGVAGGK